MLSIYACYKSQRSKLICMLHILGVRKRRVFYLMCDLLAKEVVMSHDIVFSWKIRRLKTRHNRNQCRFPSQLLLWSRHKLIPLPHDRPTDNNQPMQPNLSQPGYNNRLMHMNLSLKMSRQKKPNLSRLLKEEDTHSSKGKHPLDIQLVNMSF